MILFLMFDIRDIENYRSPLLHSNWRASVSSVLQETILGSQLLLICIKDLLECPGSPALFREPQGVEKIHKK